MLEQQKLHIVTPVLKKSGQDSLLETHNMKGKQRTSNSPVLSIIQSALNCQEI